jgi:hypothetical protein
MKAASNTAIFRPLDERINLLIPILILGAILMGLPSPAGWFSNDIKIGYFAEEILADVLLLNVVHNSFTVMMLFSFPELRDWIRRQKGGERGFLLKGLGVFLGLLLVFWLGIAGHLPYFRELIFPIAMIFPVQHALSQSFGLSLIYNRRSIDAGHAPKKWMEKSERALVLILITLMVLTTWSFMKFQLLSWNFAVLGQTSLFYVSMGIALLLVGLSAVHPKTIRFPKSLFAMRFPVWALSVLFPFALFATRAIHGIEYLFVMRKMSSNSKFHGWKSIAWLMFFGTLFFALMRSYFFSYVRPNLDRANVIHLAFIALASISIAFSYLHYYLDRQLFLLRRSLNHEVVADLLVRN